MTLEELNESIARDEIDDLIALAEARQVKRITQIADAICAQSDVRIVLVAGPSSSGKTTTAKRLRTQLRVNDRSVLLLSTDDYFVGDKLNPRDEKGHLDYEHVQCVDIARLVADLRTLVAGETILRRRFDFAAHRGFDTDEELSLGREGVVILEGIHALNPLLTQGIDDARKYGVFVRPEPSVTLFGDVAPASEDSRLLRRLVRDSHFRKTPPERTLRMWPGVLAGEKKWIYPFRDRAAASFDSYLAYELAALKPYVGGQLELLRRRGGVRGETNAVLTRLEKILQGVTPIASDKIPGESILRETIGGSTFDY